MDSDLDEHDEPMYPRRLAPNYLKFMRYMRTTLDTPLFSGGANPFDANGWIKRLERNFITCKCPLEFKMDIAVGFLAGDALFWWQEVNRGSNVKTWTEFEIEFRKRNLPPEARDSIELQFFELVQRSKSVREYESEFWRLFYFLLEDYDKEQADIRRFIRGLRPEIRTYLTGIKFNRLADVVQKATIIEANILEEQVATFALGSKALHPSCTDHAGNSRKNKSGKKKKCTACGGHHFGPCSSAKVCYNCGNLGHIARNCKNDDGKGSATMPPTKRQARNAMDASTSS
ncbi:uncharacterized protein LOC111829342 [Capsella rubella]|uniref:uncharacterized protein LOC111829342 n=1 Tax=Capsella rubella TaxID=81985 RepID=UPI000CD4AAB8|nr:uncharacterized protein LOC111829342 [Capsella rubella]